MAKKTVFITGGTGNMGWAAVQEMLKKPSEINIKMLARKSPKNEEKLKGLMAKPNGEDKLLRKVVKGMLPKNKLGDKLMGNLYIYAGSEHKQQAQNPKMIDINALK